MLSFGYITQPKTVLAVAVVAATVVVVFVIPVPSWYTYIVCCAWMKNEEHAIVPTRLIYIWNYTQLTHAYNHKQARTLMHSLADSRTFILNGYSITSHTRILVVFVIDSFKWLQKKPHSVRCSYSDALINRLYASCRLFYVRLYLPLLLIFFSFVWSMRAAAPHRMIMRSLHKRYPSSV